jgi:cytochrome c5
MSEHPEMSKTTVTQFLLALVGALVPVLIVAFLLVKLVLGVQASHITEATASKAEQAAVAAELKPVGEVLIGEAPAPVAGGDSAAKGKSVFDGTCTACHSAGVAGAPKVGDKAAWGPRIGQGKDTLYKHALGGFTGKTGTMPAKGGNTSLSDDDVKAAVDYMVSQAK